MKRVIYVVPGLDPSYKDGASNRVNSYAKCFASHGYNVTIVALCHYNKYLHCIKNRNRLDSSYNWVIIPYLFFLNGRGKNVYVYFIKAFLFLYTLIRHFDFILSDYPVGAFISSWAKKNSKLIVNHRGDAIDECMMSNNKNEESPEVKNLLYYLKFSAKVSDSSIFVSPKLKENIESRVAHKIDNYFIFPCCADLNRFDNLQCHQCNSRIVIGYFGGLNKWQNIDMVLEYANDLIKKDARFYFLLLTNSDTSAYKQQLEQLGESNYSVKSLPFSEMPEWISKMDASFVLRSNRPLNEVSSPTKISESLAAGVPIIVTPWSGDYNEVRNNDNCLVLPSIDDTRTNVDMIYDFCVKVAGNRRHIFDSCRNSVKDRSWNNFSDKFIEQIERL